MAFNSAQQPTRRRAPWLGTAAAVGRCPASAAAEAAGAEGRAGLGTAPVHGVPALQQPRGRELPSVHHAALSPASAAVYLPPPEGGHQRAHLAAPDVNEPQVRQKMRDCQACSTIAV
jgi:hypothetical protein